MTTYTVNQTYLDKANRHHPSDQFARWLTPQSGPSIANAGGIRAQRIATGPHAGELAVVYLMTAVDKSITSNHAWPTESARVQDAHSSNRLQKSTAPDTPSISKYLKLRIPRSVLYDLCLPNQT
jgi:hypothetical protein